MGPSTRSLSELRFGALLVYSPDGVEEASRRSAKAVADIKNCLPDYIARIDPASGTVSAYVDLRGLLSARDTPQEAVLNGIAYDAEGDRLFVTGKLWPRVFEIKLTQKGK